MAALRVAVQCLGPAQLLERTPALLQHLYSLPSSRILLSLQPNLRSQLSDTTVAAWSRAVAALYSGARSGLDLTVSLGPMAGEVEVVLASLPSSNPAPAPVTRPTDKLHKQVVLGGTFDRLHAGHKVLLSSALLRCTERVTVGVTGPQLLTRKTLSELILPVEERIAGVETFLQDSDPSVAATVVQIDDPFGPAITVPELHCIVASEETERGCVAINEARREAGMQELGVHLIGLVEADGRRQEEEEKVSSSTTRIRLLGSRLSPALRDWVPESGPYMVGLTGGSASGKSSVARRMEGLGWGRVDCDALGHQAYTPGAPAFEAIVAEWGQGMVAEDGTINRRALGGVVFSDPEARARLEGIVWPEIARLAEEKATALWKEGRKVVVLDAAVLLEAGWEDQCHEVWVCTVPREEAVRRIVERDGKTEQEAGNRLDSQLSNAARVARAQTVLCTLWEAEVTQRQVEAAVSRLQGELGIES